jgi:hypothetical protein
MMFAQEIGIILVPKVYGYCFNRNNLVNSHYFFMSKVTGVVFAVRSGLSEEGVQRALPQLAQIKKKLFEHLMDLAGSLTMFLNGFGRKHRTVDRQYTIWMVVQDVKRC